MAVEKQLVASQCFLRNVSSLPMFTEARQKHYLDLCKAIQTANINAEQAGKLVDGIDGQVWGPLSEELQSLVVSRHLAPGKERKRNQDYMTLPQHVPEALWQSIRNLSGHMALEKLCAHSVLLGLRHPTEWTMAMLLCVSFDRQGTLTETEQFALLRQHRERIKKLLAKPDPAVYLETLPADPRDLPESLFKAAFPDNVTPEPHTSFPMWLVRAKAWPLRSTNQCVSKGPARPVEGGVVSDGSFCQMMGQFVAGFLQDRSRAGAEGAAARRAGGEIDVQMLPAREKNGEQASKPPQTPLALTNGEEDLSTQLTKALPTRSAGASGLQTVEDSLQALREAVPASQEDKGCKVQKKPTKVLKRPAGAGPAGPPLKRPAACHRQTKTRPPESPAQVRLRLLESIPKKIRDRWKNGCARCRYRSYCTVSCWKSRGWVVGWPVVPGLSSIKSRACSVNCFQRGLCSNGSSWTFFFDSTLLCQIETAHRMTCFCFGSKYGSVGFAAGDWRRDI